MCCSGDSNAAALEKTQTAMTQTLNASYQTMFSEQQALLKPLQAQLQQMVTNPQGFSPQELATLRTSSTDQTATQFKNAAIAANTMGAAHGGADLSSGVQAGIEASVAAQGAQVQSQNQNQITLANEQQRQQNYWKAISGLGDVAGLENPTPVAGAGASVANSGTNAGNLLLNSQQASWGNIGGIISGVAGLATGLPGIVGGISGMLNPGHSIIPGSGSSGPIGDN